MSRIILDLVNSRIGAKEHVVGTAATKVDKARLASKLGQALNRVNFPLPPGFVEAAVGEEFLHAVTSPRPATIGYTTNIFGNVVDCFTYAENETPAESLLSSLAGAAKTTERFNPYLNQMIPCYMVSSDDIAIARDAARELSQNELNNLGQKIWGEKYSPDKFLKLGIKAGKEPKSC